MPPQYLLSGLPPGDPQGPPTTYPAGRASYAPGHLGTAGYVQRHLWLSSSGWRPERQLNTPQCTGQPPMVDDLALDVSDAKEGPQPVHHPHPRNWQLGASSPDSLPTPETGRHCTGVLPILFLGFSRLSCFLLETCWLHVCAGKHRGVRRKTHRPEAPACRDPQTRRSRDRLPALPDPPPAFEHIHVHPPPRTDGPSETPIWFRQRCRRQNG